MELHHNECEIQDADIALDLDVSSYNKLCTIGMLKIFTIRNVYGKLIGYASFFLNEHLHNKGMVQASQDAIFILKEYRGHGGKFIDYCDQELKKDGAMLVRHFVKPHIDFGPILLRKGYQHAETVFTKRLDKE